MGADGGLGRLQFSERGLWLGTAVFHGIFTQSISKTGRLCYNSFKSCGQSALAPGCAADHVERKMCTMDNEKNEKYVAYVSTYTHGDKHGIIV